MCITSSRQGWRYNHSAPVIHARGRTSWKGIKGDTPNAVRQRDQNLNQRCSIFAFFSQRQLQVLAAVTGTISSLSLCYDSTNHYLSTAFVALNGMGVAFFPIQSRSLTFSETMYSWCAGRLKYSLMGIYFFRFSLFNCTRGSGPCLHISRPVFLRSRRFFLQNSILAGNQRRKSKRTHPMLFG